MGNISPPRRKARPAFFPIYMNDRAFANGTVRYLPQRFKDGMAVSIYRWST